MYDSDVIDAQFHSTQHFKREQTGKWYCNYDPTNWTRRRMVHVYPDRYHEILNQARLFKGIWISTAPERFKLYLLLFRSSFQISIPGMRVCGFRERSNDCRVIPQSSELLFIPLWPIQRPKIPRICDMWPECKCGGTD